MRKNCTQSLLKGKLPTYKTSARAERSGEKKRLRKAELLKNVQEAGGERLKHKLNKTREKEIRAFLTPLKKKPTI